jgi:hypothetical protein
MPVAQALEWGVVVAVSEAFVKVDYGSGQLETLSRVEMEAVVARAIAVATFLDTRGAGTATARAVWGMMGLGACGG